MTVLKSICIPVSEEGASVRGEVDTKISLPVFFLLGVLKCIERLFLLLFKLF